MLSGQGRKKRQEEDCIDRGIARGSEGLIGGGIEEYCSEEAFGQEHCPEPEEAFRSIGRGKQSGVLSGAGGGLQEYCSQEKEAFKARALSGN